MTSISAISNAHSVNFKSNVENSQNRANVKSANDSFEIGSKSAQPPKIGFFRLAFGFLTKDQVDQINASGKLPENAKFVMNGMGGYTICNNIMGLRAGTRKIPQGFEVRQNWIGQAIVLPKDTEGALIR